MKLGFNACLVMVFVWSMLMSAQAFAISSDTLEVNEINVIGSTVFEASDLAPVLDKYSHQTLTFEQLQEAAAEIAAMYHKEGYLLVKVYIPEQKFEDNNARISVMEGTLGDVVIKGDHPFYSDKFIRKHFASIKEKNIYDQKLLERALLTLNDYPKLTVTAMLKPGSTLGTSDLEVVANNSRPLTFTLDYNNYGSKYTGKNRFGITADAGNLVVEGSRLVVRGVTSDRPDSLVFGNLDFSIPVNSKGTRMGITAQAGNFDVGEDLAVLNITNEIRGGGIYVTHPIIRLKKETLNMRLGFDIKNSEQKILNQLASEDKIRSISAGLGYETYDESGRTFLNVGVDWGLGDFLGGMEDNYYYTSRTNADGKFAKLTASVMRLQQFNDSFYVVLRGNGQYSNDSLVSSELFTIGGANSVRGYNWGQNSGDSGFNTTAELRYSPHPDYKEALQLLAFVDYGWVKVATPAVGQDTTVDLTGAGLGTRIKLPHKVDLSVDVGFPLSPSRSSEGKDVHVYVSGSVKF